MFNINNSIIKGARWGIYTGERDNDDDSNIAGKEGGIIWAKNSTFKNNRVAIEFLPYIKKVEPYQKKNWIPLLWASRSLFRTFLIH